jgi:hypothetical protein
LYPQLAEEGGFLLIGEIRHQSARLYNGLSERDQSGASVCAIGYTQRELDSLREVRRSGGLGSFGGGAIDEQPADGSEEFFRAEAFHQVDKEWQGAVFRQSRSHVGENGNESGCRIPQI